MAIFAGLDWGNAKLSGAVWRADATDARMLGTPQGAPFVPSFIGFRSMREDGRRITRAEFPPPDDWTDQRGTAISLRALKSGMPVYDDEVQTVIADAVLGFWRKVIGGEDVALSLSVPFEYSWQVCDRLGRRANEAGFKSCTCVSEPVAAVLAHLPVWQRDSARWNAVGVGQLIWVVDCGGLDATLTLLHVRAQSVLTIEFLAGDRFHGMGGEDVSPMHHRQIQDEMHTGLPRLLAAATEARRRGPGRLDVDQRHWIVPVGGGTALDLVVNALASELPKRPAVLSDVPAVEVIARGCAVHAAQQGGALSPRLSTVRRLLIGLKTESHDGHGFTAISSLADDIPFAFERAFALPEVTSEAIEVTVGAALPGGDLYAGLRTWTFEPERVSSELPSRVVLVRGRLRDWSGGTVELVNPETGQAITASEFRLP